MTTWIKSRPHIPGMGAPDTMDGTLDWPDVERRLVEAKNYWLGTTDPDGTPHAVPMWAAWAGDALYSGIGGQRTRRNLANDPRMCVHLESGTEVVIVEGTVETPESIDDATFAALKAQFLEKYDWDPTKEPDFGPTGDGWRIVRVSKVLAWNSFPQDATRFTPST